MVIITQTDKRTDITYAYETQYHWDKEKKQSRAKRVCIGKVDPVASDIIPTRGRAKKRESKATVTATGSKLGPKPFVETRHLYYGAAYLFDKLAAEIGLTADLKQCFPDTYKKLLSIACCLILEDNNPLYHFEKWNRYCSINWMFLNASNMQIIHFELAKSLTSKLRYMKLLGQKLRPCHVNPENPG